MQLEQRLEAGKQQDDSMNRKIDEVKKEQEQVCYC